MPQMYLIMPQILLIRRETETTDEEKRGLTEVVAETWTRTGVRISVGVAGEEKVTAEITGALRGTGVVAGVEEVRSRVIGVATSRVTETEIPIAGALNYLN